MSTRIGVGALYVFAASAWVSTALANVALGVCLLAFLAQLPGEWGRIRREPMFTLALIAGVYLLGNALWAMHHQPQLASAQPRAALSWFSLWLFVVTGWWCAGSERRIRIVLGLAFVSLVASLLMDFDWAQWHATLLEGRRSGIGFTAAAAGLYTATALLGWLLIATPWDLDLKSRVTQSLAFVGWIAVILLLLQVIIISQSRTTWLALILVGISLITFAACSHKQAVKALPQGQVFKIIIGMSIIAICLLGILLADNEVIVRRFIAFKDITLMDWAHTPNTIRVRLSLVQYGFEKLLERPFLGWGPDTVVTREFATADGFPALAQQPDLHNSFLVLLLRLGLFGELIYLAGAVHLSRRVWQACRRHGMSHRMFLFLLGTAGLTLLASLMNFRWTHIDFRFFWLLLAGVAFSYALGKPKASNEPIAGH